MDRLFHVEWDSLAIPTHSILESVVRGTVMYLALFVILRFVMKRQAGAIGIADILVIVLIADAAQNAFSRSYESITEGVTLVLVIVFWDFVIDWSSYRFPALRTLLQRSPLPLIADGKFLRRNMRQEYLTEDELLSLLRKQGVPDVATVKAAYMEADGQLSVIEKAKPAGRSRKVRSAAKAATSGSS